MTFQVGDRIKWKLPRKGFVTEVHEHYFCVMLGDEEWTFEHDAAGDFEIIEAAEPSEGSVVVDRDGSAVIRGHAGWYYGAAEHCHAGFAWQWKDLLEAYGPLKVIHDKKSEV